MSRHTLVGDATLPRWGRDLRGKIKRLPFPDRVGTYAVDRSRMPVPGLHRGQLLEKVAPTASQVNGCMRRQKSNETYGEQERARDDTKQERENE
jgi:hypothetical protein